MSEPLPHDDPMPDTDSGSRPLSPLNPTLVIGESESETKSVFDDEELRRANRRPYFPTLKQLANLLRSDDAQARIHTAAVIGHTLDRHVYMDLVRNIPLMRENSDNATSPMAEELELGDTQTAFVHAKNFFAYLEMTPAEFQIHEPLRDTYSASALRFLRLFTIEVIETQPERSLAMYQFIQRKYKQAIPELERSIVVEDMARHAPLGHPNPKQWLQQKKLVDQSEVKDAEFEYLACIWRYSQWYKYSTTVNWIERYYVPWHELATTKFRERVVEETLNTKPRRPLVICGGRDRAWLVHCHTTKRMYLCADSLMALCVWTELVTSRFGGVDNFGKKIPLVTVDE